MLLHDGKLVPIEERIHFKHDKMPITFTANAPAKEAFKVSKTVTPVAAAQPVDPPSPLTAMRDAGARTWSVAVFLTQFPNSLPVGDIQV